MSEDDFADEESWLDDLLRQLGRPYDLDDSQLHRETEQSRMSIRRRLEQLMAEELHPDTLDTAARTGHEPVDRPMIPEVQMTDSFDAILARSAPPATPSTAQLTSALNFLVADTEQLARKRRRVPGRLLAGVALAAATFGAGAAANAAGLFPDWGQDAPSARHLQVVTSAGSDCTATYAVTPIDPDSPRAAEAMVAAQRFLATFDIASINVDTSTEAFNRAVPQSTNDDQAAPDTQTQTRVLAVGAELYSRMRKELIGQGFDPTSVTITAFDNCEYGSQP